MKMFSNLKLKYRGYIHCMKLLNSNYKPRNRLMITTYQNRKYDKMIEIH